jgi:CheY-like chemotaxis protein
MNKLTYIDGRELDQFILKKILSRYGSPFEVKCTSSGHEALAQLISQSRDAESLPDIILLDIYTEGFDAWGFLDNLQRIYPVFVKPIEVYVLSASKYGEDVERLANYDFVKAFIVKPITKEVLLQLVCQRELSVSRFVTLEGQN